MAKRQVEKVICYVVRGDQLLVMRHVGRSPEEVGLQGPAGTIEPGETPIGAALREVIEETGVVDPVIVRSLGVAEYDISPYRAEVQRRHFFELSCADVRDRWRSQERSEREPIDLECFWLRLANAHVLQSGQGAMIHALVD